MKNILIDYVLAFQAYTNYTKAILLELNDDHLLAIASRIYSERSLNESKQKK